MFPSKENRRMYQRHLPKSLRKHLFLPLLFPHPSVTFVPFFFLLGCLHPSSLQSRAADRSVTECLKPTFFPQKGKIPISSARLSLSPFLSSVYTSLFFDLCSLGATANVGVRRFAKKSRNFCQLFNNFFFYGGKSLYLLVFFMVSGDFWSMPRSLLSPLFDTGWKFLFRSLCM